MDHIVSIVFFATVILIVYLALRARSKRNELEHQERMLALERGVDIPLTPSHHQKVRKCRNPYAWPFAFIGIGLAMVLGNILTGDYDLTWSFFPLFLGGGLLLAHYLYHKHQQLSEKSDKPDAAENRDIR